MIGSTNTKRGGGGTKSVIIVSIDTGSTVAAYTDAACTVLVKNAIEKSNGKFWLTGLDNRTYYLKATLNGDEAITSYTITEYGVYRITMDYWAAMIAVSFSTDTILLTCSDGVETINASGDLSSGAYTFTVKNTGTWTIAASNGNDSISGSVIVSEQVTYSLILPSPVPNAYQKVEYLQSTGTQYLILPITSDSINGGSVKYMVTATVNYAYLFGSNNSTSSDGSEAFGIALYNNLGFNYCGTKTNIHGQTTNTEYVLSFSVTSGNQTYINNGTTYTASTSGTPSSVTTYLFGFSYKNTAKTAELAKAKIYYCTFTDSNGDVICDLIPCYHNSDSVAGMWDRVSGTFLTNSGSGTFIVGEDI